MRPSLATIAVAFAATLGGVSLLHLVRPIDFSFDSICYLLQAQRLAGLDASLGWSQVSPCPFPSGYPAVLALFLRLGFAVSRASTLLNLVCITTAILLLRKSAGSVLNMPASWSIWPLLATISSFVLVRAVTPMLSEPLFLLLQTLALLLLARASMTVGAQQRTAVTLALAAIFCAILTRTVGVALLAPLCWLGLREIRKKWKLPQTRRTIAAVTAVAVVLGLTVALRFGAYYIDVDLQSHYGGGNALAELSTTVSWHLRELGEVIANIPLSRLSEGFRLPMTFLGAAVAVGGVVLLWVRRSRWTVFDPYVVVYSAIISIWPFYDPRFWLPVIPIAALIVVDEIRVRRAFAASRFRIALTAYGVYFLVTGTAAHALNLSRSLNRDWLTQYYSRGPFGESVLVGLGRSTSTHADSAIVRMLESMKP